MWKVFPHTHGNFLTGCKSQKSTTSKDCLLQSPSNRNPVNEDFDPLTQEAIMQVPAEEGETAGKVKQVFLKGYKLGDKVIRYAQVVVIG